MKATVGYGGATDGDGTSLLQCKAETGTTTYDDGIETEAGTNDGTVDGITSQIDGTEAGIRIVWLVVTTSPLEIIYSVVVSMITETVLVATFGGKTVDNYGCGSDVGTALIVTV